MNIPFLFMWITSSLKKFSLSFIGFILPKRMKRNLFVSSLVTQLNEGAELDEETLKKLNILLNIARDHRSLELGCSLSNSIWGGKMQLTYNHKLNTLEMQEISRVIEESCSEWLRYDHSELMRRDIRKLLEYRNETFQ